MNVLLIMPKYFDYPEVISDGLKKMGYKVDFINDRPSTNNFVKAVIRLKKEVIGIYINNYFKKVMSRISKKKYDYVILILGQSLSFNEKMISEIKKSQDKAKFIVYQWDSMNNLPETTVFYKYFDKHFTFDRKDAENNSSLQFLPLFYSPKYEKLGKSNVSKFKYDLAFVGTAHPKKYKFVKEMSEMLLSKYPKQYIYYFLPSIMVYVYRKIKNPEYRSASLDEFKFIPLTGKRMEDVIVNSRIILDTAQSGQTGLPIRDIEALGAKKKLITTNEDIRNYDFYRDENIYIYNGKGFDFNSPFFVKSYKDLDGEVYNNYSLKRWLIRLLN